MSELATDVVHTQRLRVMGMSCAACQAHVRSALERVPGVSAARVNLLLHQAEVDGSSTKDLLISAVRSSGYDAVPLEEDRPVSTETSASRVPAESQHAATLGVRASATLLAGALAMWLSMPLAMSSGAGPLQGMWNREMRAFTPGLLFAIPASMLRFVLLGLAIAAIAMSTPEIFAAAWRAARHRATNMNTLVALGTTAALLASLPATLAPAWAFRSGWGSAVFYDSVVLIPGFLLAGRWLEARARRRATADLRGVAALDAVVDARVLDLTPEKAVTASSTTLLTASATLLPSDALAAGDLLRVLPGDRLPADGVVLAGRSAVDESMLTGEPLPVTRSPGDRVAAGTINLDGILILRTTAVGSAAAAAQIRRLLESAQGTRTPMEAIADRVSSVFVPSVLVLALATVATWMITGAAFPKALSMGIAVLVVACPCAMGLAVPAAVSVATGSAAKAGLLIKGGEALERLAQVQLLAFDKTGTLTEGRPKILHMEQQPNAATSLPVLLRHIVILESHSTHPLAKALAAFANEKLEQLPNEPSKPTPLSDFRILPGVGIEGTIDGLRILVGNREVLPAEYSTHWTGPKMRHPHREGESLSDEPERQAPSTTMFAVIEGRLEAIFSASDPVRPEAWQALDQIRGLHLRTAILTGDIPATASVVQSELGVDQALSELKPVDKLAQLRSWQSEGLAVAMIGDGLNDAAALAQADVGIAMAGGADLAREAGHMLLLRPDLRLVPLAIRHARRTVSIMRGNLAWALGYNLLGLPLAAGILVPRFGLSLSPSFASAAMAFSSVAVLLNSLRLARIPRS